MTMILSSITNPRSTGWQMYVLAKSKSDSLLTNVKYSLIAMTSLFSSFEIARENDSPSRWCHRGKTIRGVSKDTRSSDSSRKAFVGWGKLALLPIGQSPYQWLEKYATSHWGKVASGKRRSWKDRFLLSSRSWEKDYLSFGRILYDCNLRFITDPRPAKHILWRCVDIWQSSCPKDKVCVWRATGQNSLKCLLSCTVPTISFNENYRITSWLC